jgi:FkbM family methyltransferase
MGIGESGAMTAAEVDAALPEPLLLPDVEELPLSQNGWPRLGSSAYYGAAALAAAYCGLKGVPDHLRGCWQHGWVASYRMPLPPDLILGFTISPDSYYWVARKDEEECLRAAGFQHVAAIGLPAVYLPPRPIRRRPDSLLVMPCHTLAHVTCSWKFDEYAEAIAAIRHEFSEVVVCISPSCWNHGYWVEAFRSRGFPLIVGANHADRNALERIRYLFSSFEYMATNSYGSQLAYAAYFGAKPSVYGPYAAHREGDFSNDPVLGRDPSLVRIALKSCSEEELRRHRPQLFCHPREAVAAVEWARFELGEANKVSPRKMRSLFQWTVADRVARELEAKTPPRVKHWARMLSEPLYRQQFRETCRLSAMPSYQPATTNLLGRPLEVLDAPRFLENKRAIFDEELYRFTSIEDAPRIIDCGASVGLSVCYFKHLYPKSNIVAFEPDPRVFETLKRNCMSWGAHDIRLIPKAVWTCEATLPFPKAGKASGRIDEGAGGEDVAQVLTCRLRHYLTERVDLLRLDIEGAEVDVLLDCADLLGQVRNLAVDYHSIFKRPQRLDELVALLTRAGFRMHFRAMSQSPSPFLYRSLHGLVESQLHIFAFRE